MVVESLKKASYLLGGMGVGVPLDSHEQKKTTQSRSWGVSVPTFNDSTNKGFNNQRTRMFRKLHIVHILINFGLLQNC